MASEVLLPDATVDGGDWGLTYNQVNTYPTHDGTVCNCFRITGVASILSMSNPGLTGPFNSLDVRLRAAYSTGGSGLFAFVDAWLIIGGSPLSAQSMIVNVAYPTFDDFNVTFTGSWTKTQLNDLQVAMVSTNGGLMYLDNVWIVATEGGGVPPDSYGFNSAHVASSTLVLPRRTVSIWPY